MAQLKDSLITGDLRVTDTIYGLVEGNSSTATKLATNGTTGQFWRGDNTWSDTISGGLLKITNNSTTLSLGANNTTWVHFTNTAGYPYYFDKQVNAVNGFKVYNTTTALADNSLTFSQGGGWSMSDDTWIRTVGNKSVYQNSGTLRTDGTLQVGANGAYFNANSSGTVIKPRLSVGTDLDTNYIFKANGLSWITGPLRIGKSDAAADTGYATDNVGTNNYIAFYGVNGDGAGSFNHTYIGESIYGPKGTSNEQSELLLFKGNDIGTANPGPDRIRLFANQVDVQVYTSALSGSWDTIRATAGTQVANFSNGQVKITGNVVPEANNTRNLGTDDLKWANAYATTFHGALSGNATSANYVNLYEARGTTTSLNKEANYVGAGKMFHLVASSQTSTTDNGKPPMGDANVLQMNWDNNGGYDAQLAISTGANRMEFRDRPSTKNSWREVVTSTPNTAAGGATTPIYVSTTGVATAVTLTGATSLRNSLGLGTGSGALAIANGGTGQTSLTAARQQFNTPEFIVGTWSAASGTWTGVTTDSSLYDGKQIILYMPYGGSGNATLNLTLSGGGTTGAKNVYFQSTTRMTTHYGQYSQIHLIYHQSLTINGTAYEGWWSLPGRDTTTTNSTQIQFNGGVKAGASALTAANIIVANTDGLYKHLKAGTAFNITQPILYLSANCNANATTGNVYSEINFTVTTTQSITLTAFRPVFIKGTLSGNIFTPVSTAPLTQTIPTTKDNYQYIYLGYAYNTSAIRLTANHQIYEYFNDNFQLYEPNKTGYTVWYDDQTGILHFDSINDDEASTLSQAVAQLQALHGTTSGGAYKTVAQEVNENKTITETTDFNISGNRFNMVVNN